MKPKFFAADVFLVKIAHPNKNPLKMKDYEKFYEYVDVSQESHSLLNYNSIKTPDGKMNASFLEEHLPKDGIWEIAIFSPNHQRFVLFREFGQKKIYDVGDFSFSPCLSRQFLATSAVISYGAWRAKYNSSFVDFEQLEEDNKNVISRQLMPLMQEIRSQREKLQRCSEHFPER